MSLTLPPAQQPSFVPQKDEPATVNATVGENETIDLTDAPVDAMTLAEKCVLDFLFP